MRITGFNAPMKIQILIILLFSLFVSIPSFAGQPQQPVSSTMHTQEKKPPVAPDFDATGPNFLIFLGALIAGAIQLNPWIALAIGAGIILITLILIALIDIKTLIPKGRNIAAKIIAIILVAILGLLLLFLAIAAAVIGLAFLIGALLSTSANPLLGAAVFVAAGLLWLLVKLIVYIIRSIRYKKAKKEESFERA